jgi:calcium-dependent protein kinase
MKKLFLAINHCHSNGVVHRDLKPENIMYKENLNSSTLYDQADIKIIDFGLSKIFNPSDYKSMKTMVGTPYYVAPEVLDGHYGNECDCWSLGIIMYAVLSGCLPFFGPTAKDVFDKIKEGKVNFAMKEFRNISDTAKDLISKLLCVKK